MKKSLFLLLFLSALSLTSKAATATVYVDKSESVDFFVKTADGWTLTALDNAGETPNSVRFSTATCDFMFTPIDMLRGIYRVTKNDETVERAADGSYIVAGVKDGDVIRVTVESPVYDCNVTFAKGLEAISKIVVNDTQVTAAEGNIVVKTYDQVQLYPNAEYTISKVDVNGKEISFVAASGCYAFNVVEDNTVVTITAEKKSSTAKTVTANIDNSAAVKLYLSAKYYNVGDAVSAADKFEVAADKPFVQVAPAEGYKILTAQYVDSKGNTADMTYYSFEDLYYVNAIEKDVVAINITTQKEVAQTITATLWVDDVTLLQGYFVRTADRKFPFDSDGGPYLATGTQTLTITAAQNPVRLNLDFNKRSVSNNVYLNDVRVNLDEDDTSVWGDITLADGDVLKIYADPEHVTAISNAATTTRSQDNIFTLQGVRVGKNNKSRGLYIVNGKKVLR
ncbi:MAG: hypothetical protein HUK06_06890 [Bacteroidaceae bacterium]|nr:hypothetical protein [Bacteroidaceae bacterium]